MNSKRLLLVAVGVSAGLVAACHDNNNNNPPVPMPSTNLSLDTAHVLVLAQNTSETASPLPVDGGALTLTDTSDTSSPIAVNGS